MHFQISILEMLTIKKIVVVSTLLLFIVNLIGQTDSLSTIEADMDTNMMVGKCNRIELQDGEMGQSFFEAYRIFKPDAELLELIKNKIFDCTVTIVLGSWCHDSHQQVPAFIKILDAVDYNTNYLKIICVDKNKKAGDSDISALNILKVPTFIFYRKNKELGRIVETPTNTLEIDIYNIIKE